MANFIGRLGVVLGLDTAEFSRGIDAAGKKLGDFATSAVSAGKTAALALVAAGAAAARYADEIVDTAKANEIAVDTVLKLRSALALSGGEASNAGKLMSSFTANIDKAAEGSFETQKVLKTLGFSLDDLRKMGMDEMFSKTVEGLAAMSDPITRNAKAMELFGKSAKGVDFVELNEQLKTNANVSQEQAKGIEAAAEAYDNITKNAQNFAVILTAEIGPSLKTTVKYITDLTKESSAFSTIFGAAFNTVAMVAATSATAIQIAFDTVDKIIQKGKLLLKGDIDGIIALDKKTSASTDERIEKLTKFYRQILGPTSENEKPNETVDKQNDKRKVIAGIDKEADKEKKRMLDLYLKGLEEENKQREETNKLQAEQETFYQLGNAAEAVKQGLAKQGFEREKERLILGETGKNMRAEDLHYAQAALEIEYKRKDLAQQIRDNKALDIPARNNALQRNNELAQQSLDIERERYDMAKRAQEGGLMGGFMNAAENTVRSAKTEFERGQQAFESVMSNMESALDRFVRTGKLSFKDFARSVIQDLIAIQMKAQMMEMMKGLGGMFGGSSFGSPSDYSGIGSGGVLPFADGGDPPVGRASLVGERGPELFVPRTAGTIVPNHQLSSAMGGGQTVNYNGPFIQSMNAIDTQSGVQFLVQNKSTIWAANQSAQRSLPMSK